MSSYRSIIHLITRVLLFFISTSLAEVKLDEPLYLYNICPNTTSFTRGSTYESNLRALLSTLSASDASSYTAGFKNATSGLISDVVYGLFLCRGDVSVDVCRNCVGLAAKEALQRCPIGRKAIVWFNRCMLHYSDVNFFGTANTDQGIWMPNITGVSSNLQMDFGSFGLIYTLIDRAQHSEKLYAQDESKATESQTRYGMVQCTRDIDAEACGSCLNNLTKEVDKYYRGRVGWRALTASCAVRYELYAFFNGSSNTEAFPPLPPETGKAKQSKVRIVVPAVVSSAVAIAFLVGFWYYKRRARKGIKSSDKILLKDFKGRNNPGPLLDGGIMAGDHDSEQQMDYLSLDNIITATNGFSEDNKLGEGGFGPVYKGKLPNGMDVAIKRLSKKSTQGLTEFKNEVILVIKLQHRNLVRLLGYCVEEDEKLLVYEYMPNKSLDAFLFGDPFKRQELDWKKRMKIIHGTAKGLQYLHEDSRLKIIHRDLKASNILLDDEMNPKISDFGTARIFGYNQMQDSTEKIIGTLGYMSPEYALGGMISEKSDVYSFGILLLEIVSGEKTTRFNHNQQFSLVVHAWESWCETKGLNLVDQSLGGEYSPPEAMRCVHIALLCVQDLAIDRPSISQVVHLLNNDKEAPYPKQPTFTVIKTLNSDLHSSSNHVVVSVYEATQTILEGR